MISGRPQYDSSGEAILITQGDALPRYLRLFVQALPIESKLTESLVDNLNAEINLGTVTNFAEAQRWIRSNLLPSSSFFHLCKFMLFSIFLGNYFVW